MWFFPGTILNGRFRGNADIQTWLIEAKRVAAFGQKRSLQTKNQTTVLSNR
jgi:hypothetical protein